MRTSSPAVAGKPYAVIGTHQAFRHFERERAWNLDWHRDGRFRLRGDPREYIWVSRMEKARGIPWTGGQIVGPVDNTPEEHFEIYEYVQMRAAR